MPSLPFIEAFKDKDQKFYELINGIQELIQGESSLDPKTKMMISLAVDAAEGSTQGVAAISDILRNMGVTDEQIAEVLRITYFAKGNSVLSQSLAAFK
ncbi:MAG: carboxymuconolactone decarboxylase family protein [Thermincola sp.]|jgi:alkylhydroperoxidase/carboxymuconolactone decarboxylase family protein YurZ|nr:carboxymuconolactone decarboxylase family protein [Thermincola sp.]MDT3703630.1 carboxymuconolactone decarboxylase family protein [Thermincola sp.]